MTAPVHSPGHSPTFADAYCRRHRCTLTQFPHRVFWSTLHRRALPFAPFLILGGHFKPDHDLIAACGRAHSIREIEAEIREHHFHPLLRQWLRDRLMLRVSRARLLSLARQYLAGGGGHPLPAAAGRPGGRQPG